MSSGTTHPHYGKPRSRFGFQELRQKPGVCSTPPVRKRENVDVVEPVIKWRLYSVSQRRYIVGAANLCISRMDKIFNDSLGLGGKRTAHQRVDAAGLLVA